MIFNLDWKKLALYGLLCVSIPALLIGFLTSGSSDKQIQVAFEAFANWKKAPSDLALEKKMRKTLNNTPHLKRAFQAEIVQTLLSNGSSEAVETMGAHCLRQLEKESPFHAQFAHTSFFIEKKQYQTALEQAVALKEKIEIAKETQRRSILYAYNLVRIAFLQKQLVNNSGELAAWEEVKSLLEGENSRSDAIQLLETNFQKKSGKKIFSLADFISQRERVLLGS
jgi:hypothetical protein